MYINTALKSDNSNKFKMQMLKICFIACVLVTVFSTEAVTATNVTATAAAKLTVTATDCLINIQKNSPQDPLLLDSHYVFQYPTNPTTKETALAKGEKMYIGCPGGLLNDGNLQEGLYECDQGTIFLLPNSATRTTDFNTIVCSASGQTIGTAIEHPHDQQTPFPECFSSTVGTSYYGIGYTIDAHDVYGMHVCFNNTRKMPLYFTYYLAQVMITGAPNDRPRFFHVNDRDPYGSINFNNVYNPSQQLVSIQKLAPSNLEGIELSDDKFWNGGQLATSDNFYTRFERYTSFDYINVAPQWSEFINGNWKELQMGVKQFTQATNQNAYVHVGTLGIATFSSYGNPVDFYVDDGDDDNKIPVPKWFWMSVDVRGSSTDNKLDYVFLGFNNPYALEDPIQEYEELCDTACSSNEDVSKLLTMPNYVPNDLFKGYMFACEKSCLVKGTELDYLIRNIPTSG